MTVKDISNCLEEMAPLGYAESFDNVGLLIGDYAMKVTGVLVTLDTLENIVEEAIAKDCNMIVSFHPIIFSGLKKINGTNYVERVVLKAIKHDIAIYSMHTALDNTKQGVNAQICNTLGLRNQEILIPKKESLRKLTTYVPSASLETVRNALFTAGAGALGEYSNCSFSVKGEGTFKAGKNSNPFVGNIGELHKEEEMLLSITFESYQEKNIVRALQDSHPYEEVAYEVTAILNKNQHTGMGMVGTLEKSMDTEAFLHYVKEKMNTECIRHSKTHSSSIQKVAVLGGSGSFAIRNAIAAGADAYITADLKYHEFYQAENSILLCDIGHYESEQFTKNLLVEYLTKKIPNFAIHLSEKRTNPIYYI